METEGSKYQYITIDIDKYKKIRPYLEGYFNDQYPEIAIFPEIKPFKNIGPAKELTLTTYLPNIETIFENDPYIRKFLDTLTPDNYDTILIIMIRFVGSCVLLQIACSKQKVETSIMKIILQLTRMTITHRI